MDAKLNWQNCFPLKCTYSLIERCGSRVVRAARLWCRKSPEGRESEAGIRHQVQAEVTGQSGQGLHCFLFHLRPLEASLYLKIKLFRVRTVTVNYFNP